MHVTLYVPGTIMVTVLTEALSQEEHLMLDLLSCVKLTRLAFINIIDTRQVSFPLCVTVKFLPFTVRVSCGLTVATKLNGENSEEFQKRQLPLIVQV